MPAGENRTLPHYMKTLPEHLKTLGYSTHLVGKWHLGSGYKNVTPTQRGFDTHYGFWNGYIGYFDYVSPSFKFKVPTYFYKFHHLSKNPSEYNFRFSFSFIVQGKDIHDGFEPVPSVVGQYATEVFTKRAEAIINNHDTIKPLFLLFSHLAAHTGSDGIELGIENVTDNDIKFGYIRDERRRLYAGVMKSFDDSLGRVIKSLMKKNMLHNTIVLLLSDNGGPTVDDFNNTSSNWPLRGVMYHIISMKMTLSMNLRGSRLKAA